MILSESYKNRIKSLAGILNEISNLERAESFSKSDQRVPYNKDMMIQAIQEGREVGILFQTNNDKMKSPTSKYRIIYPVAIVVSKKGNAVIRAFHKMGQSEKEARLTGKRSAEVENTWRLMKVSNIKGMWFTGRYFRGPLESYDNHDKGMMSIEISADFSKIRKFQDQMIKKTDSQRAEDGKKKNIVNLFKNPEDERQLKQQNSTYTTSSKDINSPKQIPEEEQYSPIRYPGFRKKHWKED